jgi:beta-lactam-binding protein with PASTA domain
MLAVTPSWMRAAAQQDASVARQIQGRRMPNLIGLDTLTAIRQLRSLAVARYAVRPPQSGLTPIDSITSQFPLPDSILRGGDTVWVGLAARVPQTKRVPVPYVVGLSEREAAATLSKMRLVGATRDEPAPGPEWLARVLRQAPDGGRQLSPGSIVTIWVGRDTRVAMPLVTGQTRAEASGVLREAGVVAPPIVDVMPGDGQALDSIVRQSPDPGTPVWPETRAILTLARHAPVRQDAPATPPSTLAPATPPTPLAPATPPSPVSQADSVFVPLVIGLNVDSARAVLTEAGLATRVDALVGGVLLGRATVRNQLPEVGTIVPAGTVVAIAPVNVVAAVLIIPLLFVGGTLAARALCPTPTIAQIVRLYPAEGRVKPAHESLVLASVSLRSRVEHRGAELDVGGSLLA